MATQNCNGIEESSSASTDPAPTCYKIHSREHLPRSWFLWTWMAALLVPVSAVGIGAVLPSEFSVDDVRLAFEQHKDDTVAMGCLLFAALSFLWCCHRYCCYSYCYSCSYSYLLSTRHQIRDTELSLTVCPLGIQRSKAITTTTTTLSRNGAANPNDRQEVRVCNLPFLPMESIRDCILLEHVGGFSVSTHVMIRLFRSGAGHNEPAANSKSNPLSKPQSELVSAFPDADMTFDQCHGLVQQIQRALGEMR